MNYDYYYHQIYKRQITFILTQSLIPHDLCTFLTILLNVMVLPWVTTIPESSSDPLMHVSCQYARTRSDNTGWPLSKLIYLHRLITLTQPKLSSEPRKWKHPQLKEREAAKCRANWGRVHWAQVHIPLTTPHPTPHWVPAKLKKIIISIVTDA